MPNYTCPACGTQYDIEQPGEYQCQCGKVFTFPPAPVPAPAPAPAQPAPEVNLCPYCKSPLAPGAMKCAHCGEWISETASKSKSTYILLAILFGPIAEFYLGNYLLGVVFMFFYYGALYLWFSCSRASDAAIGAVIAGVVVLFYWVNVFFTKVGAEAEAAIQEAKKKGPSSLFWFYIFLALVIIGGAVAVLWALKNNP